MGVDLTDLRRQSVGLDAALRWQANNYLTSPSVAAESARGKAHGVRRFWGWPIHR
jgi:hypothetical protein